MKDKQIGKWHAMNFNNYINATTIHYSCVTLYIVEDDNFYVKYAIMTGRE